MKVEGLMCLQKNQADDNRPNKANPTDEFLILETEQCERGFHFSVLKQSCAVTPLSGGQS